MDQRHTFWSLMLACAGLATGTPTQAKQCTVNFYLSVLHADGSTEQLCYSDGESSPQSIAVILLPGDSLSVQPEYYDECYGNITLEVHQNAQLDPATATDPIVLSAQADLVLVLGHTAQLGAPLHFAIAGSFYIRATGDVDWSAEVSAMVTEDVSTVIGGPSMGALAVHYAQGSIVLEASPGGQLQVLNAAGQRVMERFVPASATAERIPFTNAPGVYLVSLRSGNDVLRGKVDLE